MTNNEMPSEIYVQLGENRIGTEICLRKWSENPFEDGTKYIRADSQPADVAEALAIADARGDEVKELDFGNVFWACGVLAEKVRALTAQQPDVNKELLAVLSRIEGVICHEVCSSTNKQISDSGELCRVDISKIRRFILHPVGLKELKLKEYNDFKQRVALEQEKDDDNGKRAEQKGQSHD